jgi:ankyrin repeat protein
VISECLKNSECLRWDNVYDGKFAVVKWHPVLLSDNDGRYTVELIEAVAPTPPQRIDVMETNIILVCCHCHAAEGGRLLSCSKCYVARYCSGECQRNDWQRHKVDCKELGNWRTFLKKKFLLAVNEGQLAAVQRLLENGADIHESDNTGMTALHICAKQGNLGLLQYLVQQGADKDKVNLKGVTALHVAAEEGNTEMVQYLVQQGADKDKATGEGVTPLHICANEGHLGVLQYLVQQGADKDKANINGSTPLYIAAGMGNMEVVHYLVQQGADLEKANNMGASPIHVAAGEGHVDVIEYFYDIMEKYDIPPRHVNSPARSFNLRDKVLTYV